MDTEGASAESEPLGAAEGVPWQRKALPAAEGGAKRRREAPRGAARRAAGGGAMRHRVGSGGG